MLARGTRRRRCSPGAHDTMCAWCKHMRDFGHPCTWKPRGQQDQFLSAADVSAACFGHMVASVWDGSVVRQQNKDRLKRCLAMSVSERGSGEDAPPQHAWAAALLDACKLEELRSRRSRNSNVSNSSGDSGSSGDDSSSGGSGSSGDDGCHYTAQVEAFRDWGTPYAHVDRLLKGPQRGVMPGVLKGDGRRCRWCSHQYSVGDSVYVQHNGVRYHGIVASFPTGAGSNGVTHVGVELQRGQSLCQVHGGSAQRGVVWPQCRPTWALFAWAIWWHTCRACALPHVAVGPGPMSAARWRHHGWPHWWKKLTNVATVAACPVVSVYGSAMLLLL